MIMSVKEQTILTEKEIEILSYIANGEGYSQTAVQLKTNEQCIKNNMFKIMKKLNANNNVHAVVRGIEMELLVVKKDE